MPEALDPVVTISLLDTVAGYAVQSWEFEGANMIRIGRGETNDVVLSDTSVSRMHGELARTEAGWSVTALRLSATKRFCDLPPAVRTWNFDLDADGTHWPRSSTKKSGGRTHESVRKSGNAPTKPMLPNLIFAGVLNRRSRCIDPFTKYGFSNTIR